MRAALTSALITLAAPVAAGPPVLALPIDCELGQSCYVQHYVDLDPTEGVLDFHCGDQTYDGHKGTDIAVPTLADMHRGVDVLASASGQVVGVRDGEPDIMFSAETAAATNGRECGNGVVLRHADGWETQYCHMKSGSIAVRNGDQITQGQVLGQVGLSGRTQFPHIHLSVRKDGEVIDPYAPNISDDAAQSCGPSDQGLWDHDIAYVPGGLIYAAFTDGIPTFEAVKDGSAALPVLAADAGALVLYAYAFGGRQGDAITMQITGPNGPFLSQNIALEKNQAQLFRATGKRLKTSQWPAGEYVGDVRMMRGDLELDRYQVQMRVD